MNKRIAILDLGTNTFHLLIADIKPDHSFEILFKAEEFVKLGEEGLGRIGDQAFQRGLEQVRKYKASIDQYHPLQVIGFGTAAIRSASNGDEFISAIKSICPIELRKISGDEEAMLIYLGVRQAVKMNSEPQMIMDIGGGSTEFIIADDKQILWKQSFPVGASVLKQKFHHHEPITKEEVLLLKEYLRKELQPLFSASASFNIVHLIGASGSFDTFTQMIAHRFYSAEILKGKTSHEILPHHFKEINDELIRSNFEQRLQMKGMISFRAEMITVAGILTELILEKFSIGKITWSAYALKEGVLWKILQNEKV